MHISVVPTIPLQKDKLSEEEAESYKAMILWAGHSTAHAWREWADPPLLPTGGVGRPACYAAFTLAADEAEP